MPFSRRLLLVFPLAILAGRRAAAAADPGAAPVALVERFYATLLAVMKEAKKLSFDERYKRLAPAIEQTFDLGLMTRIAIGPGWAGLAPDQQQRLGAYAPEIGSRAHIAKAEVFKEGPKVRHGDAPRHADVVDAPKQCNVRGSCGAHSPTANSERRERGQLYEYSYNHRIVF